MSGYPLRTKNPSGTAPILTRNGNQDVWEWSTLVGDHKVRLVLDNIALLTLANRAVRNKSGRATQGGISASVVSA